MVKGKTEEIVITDLLCVAEESMEAVMLEGEEVIVFLKSGNKMVVKNVPSDGIHAKLRYDELKKGLRSGAGYNSVTDIDDMDALNDALQEESESSEEENNEV